MGQNLDRLSYDTGASTEVQGGLHGIVGQLEAVLGDRDRAVKAAMTEFQADGVSDEYHGKEIRWNKAAHQVREIIRLVRTTLEQNDGTAQSTLAKAKAAVDAIG
ncbi:MULTISPECIES: pore-forming ESAT-6 family protein [unclassified Streptomyces]|uniref:pore-forming ESAT-6 family protein n=1 Tax=unclassified Streptomyces TaxID=2593676 RepID=UPI002DD8CC9F|nr:pore-forming ESAT-6 family protein [Streptomyces sp. NBC_01750]WSA99039.1 pore-forming ESAT-6 family protein [Streptomyces sp. NBC_01794]WSD36395.1 pore-forming ESAT-6 family protein [Streptomyces sp. NBC_01750]